jgi:hypothetical protein
MVGAVAQLAACTIGCLPLWSNPAVYTSCVGACDAAFALATGSWSSARTCFKKYDADVAAEQFRYCYCLVGKAKICGKNAAGLPEFDVTGINCPAQGFPTVVPGSPYLAGVLAGGSKTFDKVKDE